MQTCTLFFIAKRGERSERVLTFTSERALAKNGLIPRGSAAGRARAKRAHQRVQGSALGFNTVYLRGVRGLDLIAAADIVVTDYGTEGVKACLMGVPTAFLMFDSADEYLRGAKGTQHPHFSILEERWGSFPPALGIYEPKRIKDLSLLIQLNWRIRQGCALGQSRFKILCDGHAGERVVEFIKEIVSK